MDGVSWIKIQTNIFDNQKIIAIENMPEGDSILVIWLKLLALAGKVNMDGMIYLTNDIPFTDQLLSYQFRKPLQIVQLALKTFEHLGMIEIVNDIICVSNWAKYQNVEGLEKVREQGRLRQERYRERKRLEAKNDECNVTGNVTSNGACNADITHPSYIDIDKEKDIKNIKENITKESEDLEFLNSMVNFQKTKRKPKTNELLDTLDSYGFDSQLREALIDFIEMRKKKKRPLTERALNMVIKKLTEMSSDVKTQIAIVNQSILHNWDTVYELKKDGTWGNNKPNQWDTMAVSSSSKEWEGVGHL